MQAKKTTQATRSIRWHLFQFLLVCVVPLGLFAGLLLYLHWEAQEAERERAQVQTARLLAAAVDNALDSSVQRLQLLAGSWASRGADDATMYARAREAVRLNPDWQLIVVFRADGSGLLRSDLPPTGTPIPGSRLFQQWRPVLDEGRPVISQIFTSPSRGTKEVGVGVPVVQDGRVTHVLIANLNLRWFDDLLRRQGLSGGGVGGIFDRNWKFVARSADGDARRGSDPQGDLLRDMLRAPEGVGRYTSLDGHSVYSSWAPTRNGWRVAFATSASPIDGAFWRYLTFLGAAWAAIVAIIIAWAYLKGRRIASALVSLEARSAQLAAGRRLEALVPSKVSEVDHALAGLSAASEVVEGALMQRDSALEVEREARAAAETANRAKDEFLAMLGHELRNPLAAIASAVYVAAGPARTPDQLEVALAIIRRQSAHLQRLVDDLLDVGRVMGSRLALEREPLDLAESARHVVAALESTGRFARRHLELDLQPAWVLGDRTRIEQIVTNLLTNAAAYTSTGGRISVRVVVDGDDALLEVIDDGRGIAPESLTSVFDLFYQADPTLDRSGGGLGVGLTVVRRLVELHGGLVRAHSHGRGRGATFTVSLPAAAAPGRTLHIAQPADAPRPLDILLVEDNADAREGLRLALEMQGHRVVAASDGAQALELLRSFRPTACIFDVGLPGEINGYHLARLTRERLGAEVLLVAVTGYGTAKDRQLALDAGFDRHMAKPIDPDALVRELYSARHTRSRAA